MEQNILTNEEQDLVIAFNENQKLREAVRKVLTASIYNKGVIRKENSPAANINWILKYTPAWNEALQKISPAEVGLKVMVAAEALAQLENAFGELCTYTKVVEKPNKPNKAK